MKCLTRKLDYEKPKSKDYNNGTKTSFEKTVSFKRVTCLNGIEKLLDLVIL